MFYNTNRMTSLLVITSNTTIIALMHIVPRTMKPVAFYKGKIVSTTLTIDSFLTISMFYVLWSTNKQRKSSQSIGGSYRTKWER